MDFYSRMVLTGTWVVLGTSDSDHTSRETRHWNKHYDIVNKNFIQDRVRLALGVVVGSRLVVTIFHVRLILVGFCQRHPGILKTHCFGLVAGDKCHDIADHFSYARSGCHIRRLQNQPSPRPSFLHGVKSPSPSHCYSVAVLISPVVVAAGIGLQTR
ncbi:hypothetical protein DY000_02002282 [Brassica cretica]|uniref:Uncharacterized protein n=1 Tax=Brassica cretica TaxID=69181 RepID=A0ABQ7CFT7_BRACR|nr:hypothetical protein DY000_02002282 [Brassica cretica]